MPFLNSSLKLHQMSPHGDMDLTWDKETMVAVARGDTHHVGELHAAWPFNGTDKTVTTRHSYFHIAVFTWLTFIGRESLERKHDHRRYMGLMNVPSYSRKVGEILNPRDLPWHGHNARAEMPLCRDVSGNYNQDNRHTDKNGVRYALVFVPHAVRVEQLATDGLPPWKPFKDLVSELIEEMSAKPLPEKYQNENPAAIQYSLMILNQLSTKARHEDCIPHPIMERIIFQYMSSFDYLKLVQSRTYKCHIHDGFFPFHLVLDYMPNTPYQEGVSQLPREQHNAYQQAISDLSLIHI